MNDYLNAKGWADIHLYDCKGNLKFSLTKQNLIVQTGKDYLVSKIFENFLTPQPEITKFTVGSGTTPADLSDTSLENKTGETTISSYTIESNKMSLFGGLIQGVGTGTISELGLETADDVLISRIVVTTPFQKTVTDFLNISWSIEVG